MPDAPFKPAAGADMNLTAEIAKALGLPKHTARASLTLEAGSPPRLALEVKCVDSAGHLVVEDTADLAGNVTQRLAQVQFMLRLERFSS